MLSLIAEAVEPISGFSGWFGATALGGVLSWLLFVYLPSKDKQLKEFIENKDEQLDVLLKRKEEMLDRMAEHYRADLRLVAEHCQSEMREFGDRFKVELGLLRESMVTSIRELLAQQREK